MHRPAAQGIAVVVPAHDEEDLLPGCLASVRDASDAPGLPPVRVVVVADACTDATAAAARDVGVEVLEIAVRSAGAARAAGLAHCLAGARPGLWLATTDADSRVPPDWLVEHLAWHDAGWDAVVGTIRVEDWSGHAEATRAAFGLLYGDPGEGHPHVHGANLGVSAAAYASVGGFPDVPVAEDHALVDALVAGGHRVVRAARPSVVTSARRDPRAAGGFGDLLRDLAEERPPSSASGDHRSRRATPMPARLIVRAHGL
jgi:glycosyltransferase involved in cell wall biosynthesis